MFLYLFQHNLTSCLYKSKKIIFIFFCSYVIHCGSTPEITNIYFTPKRFYTTELQTNVIKKNNTLLFLLPKNKVSEVLPSPNLELKILSGLDVLAQDGFHILKNRRFALFTNSTSRDLALNTTLDLLMKAKIKPKLLFEAEHGLYASVDTQNKNPYSKEKRYKLPLYSLYNTKSKQISPRILSGLDILVVDIQSLPLRCYTYNSTLYYLMQAAEKAKITLLVLDRPNPYNFLNVQGGTLKKKYSSFVSLVPVPFLFHLTTGELAYYLRSAFFKKLKLEIVLMANYKNENIPTSMKQIWVNPSPNLPSMESALVYPGMVLFEGVEDFSLGRGTTRPFVYSGAPWLNSRATLHKLKSKNLKGVEMGEIFFEPTSSIHSNKNNAGIMIIPTSINFDSIELAYHYLSIVKALHPKEFKYRKSTDKRYFIDLLWGGTGLRHALDKKYSYEAFKKTWQKEAKDFENKMQAFKLYN